MSKKAKNGKTRTITSRDFGDMTYKDLKKAVVLRGMDFEEVITGDFPRLQGWLYKNQHLPQDKQLLTEFDNWVDENLRLNGSHDLVHPQLRLGYVGDREGGELKIKKEKPIKLKKTKREKTAQGVYKGTKKALTLSLAEEGETLENTIEQVIETFPDASAKSIKIWYKKYLRDVKK